MTFQKTVTLVAGGIVALGLLFGQAMPANSSDSGQDWEMLSQTVDAGAAGGQSIAGGTSMRGEVFLYNKRTGKVYLRFTGCTSNGEELDGGCFASIAVFGDNPNVSVTPTPTNGEWGQRY